MSALLEQVRAKLAELSAQGDGDGSAIQAILENTQRLEDLSGFDSELARMGLLPVNNNQVIEGLNGDRIDTTPQRSFIDFNNLWQMPVDVGFGVLGTANQTAMAGVGGFVPAVIDRKLVRNQLLDYPEANPYILPTQQEIAKNAELRDPTWLTDYAKWSLGKYNDWSKSLNSAYQSIVPEQNVVNEMFHGVGSSGGFMLLSKVFPFLSSQLESIGNAGESLAKALEQGKFDEGIDAAIAQYGVDSVVNYLLDKTQSKIAGEYDSETGKFANGLLDRINDKYLRGGLKTAANVASEVAQETLQNLSQGAYDRTLQQGGGALDYLGNLWNETANLPQHFKDVAVPTMWSTLITEGLLGLTNHALNRRYARLQDNQLLNEVTTQANEVTPQVADALYRENEVDRLENEYLDWYRDWGEPIEQRDAARADDYNEEDLAEANRQVEEFTAEQEQQRKAQEQAKREQEAADRELEAEDYLAKLERDLTRQQQINQEYDLNALDDYYINEYENEAENLQRTNNNIVQNQRINQSQADINAQNRAYNANKQARQAQSEQQARENARLEQERENNANYNNSLAGITGRLVSNFGEPNGAQKSNAYGNNVFNELNNTVNNLEARNNRLNGDINILDNVKRELENLRDRIRSGLEDGKSYKIRERIRNLINTLKAVRQQRKEQEQARQAQDQARQAQDTEDYYAKLDRDLSRQQQLENEYDLNALDDYYTGEYEAETLERQREIKRKMTQNDREEYARRVENEAIREARTAQDKENAEFDSLVREADEQYIDPNSEFGQLLNEGDRQLEAAKDFKEARFGVKLSTLPEGEREKAGAARRRIAERRRQSPEYKRFEQNVKKFLAKRQAAREEEEFNSLLRELDEAGKTSAALENAKAEQEPELATAAAEKREEPEERTDEETEDKNKPVDEAALEETMREQDGESEELEKSTGEEQSRKQLSIEDGAGYVEFTGAKDPNTDQYTTKRLDLRPQAVINGNKFSNIIEIYDGDTLMAYYDRSKKQKNFEWADPNVRYRKDFPTMLRKHKSFQEYLVRLQELERQKLPSSGSNSPTSSPATTPLLSTAAAGTSPESNGGRQRYGNGNLNNNISQPAESVKEPEVKQVKQAETNPKNRDTIKTAAGLEDTVTYKIVDASELIVSNKETGAINPDYPQELQPRDRTRQASLEQVAKIAQSLDPELLGRNKMASDGAPIVGSDMVVESGNGRVMAILQAFKNGKADKYIKYMREHAAEFGLSEADFNGIKQPVLVRVRDGKIDRKTFVQQANISTVSSMSPAERAKQDAAKITVNMLSKFDPNKEIRYNGEFIQDFASQIVEDNERGAFIDKNGQLSVQGLERVQNALLALAYQDDNLLIRMRESLDNDIKNVTNAMLQAAPKVALLEQGVKTGEIKSELSIHKDITQAASALAQIRRDGMTVQDYLAQNSLFSDANISNTAKALLQFFDDHKRSTKKITDLLIKYAELALNEGAANQQNMFGESQTRGKAHLLNDAIKYAKDAGNYGQIGLFGESYEQRTPREIDKDQISETYGEDEALDNVINSNEQYTRNVALGLDEAAEQVGKLEDAINSKAKNRPNADLSIKDDILNAVRAYDKLTKAGASVNAALNKLLKNESVPELKGLKLSDGAIGVLEIFDKVKGSGAKIAAALINYSENALKADGRSKQELLTDALNYLDAKDGYQLDLDTRRLEQRIYNILKGLNHEQIDEASAAVYAPVIASRYKFLARISGLSIDDLINRRVFAYRADDSEKRGRGRPRKNTDTFNQPVIPEDQIEAVRKKYEGTEQWLKAPNGKKSNLNERQWLQVRTPAFKNWFGFYNLPQHKFTITNTEAASFNNVEDALKWAKDNGIIGLMFDSETNGKGEINISTSSIREMLNPRQRAKSASNEVHYAALTKLRDIIRESELIDSHPDYKKGADGKRDAKNGINPDITIDVIYGAMRFNGENYRVKTTLKRYNQADIKTKAYAYEVSEIEVMPGTLGQLNNQSNPTDTTSILGNILLQGVQNSKGNLVLEDFSQVVDENGEPLVVYRGTPEKMGGVFEYGRNFYGGNRGFWFTTAETAAKDYSFDENNGTYGEVKAVYLNAKNILDLTPLKLWCTSKQFCDYVRNNFGVDLGRGSKKEYRVNELYEKYQDSLYSLGEYDAIKLCDVGITYIVKTSEQIKSATDNNGEFNPNNPNIYYQAQIAQGEGLYDGLNLPFDPADLRTESGASIENAAKSDKILTPDGSSTLGVIDNAMQSQDGTEFPAGNIQANAGAVQYIERRHGNEIRDVGYKDAQTFLLDVLNNYGQIYRGDNNAIILVSHGDAEHSVKSVVSLEQDKNGVYAVNDAGIVRNQYLKNKELLYTRSEPYATSPRTGTAGLLESGQSRGTPKFYATPSSNSEQIINQNLNQDKGGVLRGKIDFDKQGKAIIHILKAANKSTVLHETAHLFLQDFRDLATNPDIQLTEAARNDWDALCDWLGIKDLDFSNPEGWSKAERDLWNDAQEKFAAGTEKYLWEGKVPTKNSRLKRIFEIIKGWFRAIYEKARDIKYINSKGEAVSFNISKAAHDVYDHIHTGGENMTSWKSERAANLEIGKADPNEYLTEDKLKDNNFVETTDEIDAQEVAELKAEREVKAAEDARPKNELGVLEDSEEHINNNNNNTEVKTLADMSEAITNPKKRGRPKTGGVLEGVKARLRALNRGEMITNLHPVNEPETTSVESEAISETIKDKRSSDSMLFTNPETEARFRNSRGDIQVRESTRNFWKDVGLKALSKNSKSGQNLINAKETFKRLTQSISASTSVATNDMKKIIKNLTPAETELFMRKRIVDDLMWRKQEMPEAKLPWGLDGETLKADYERITKLAEANKNVANAIKADEQAISDLNKQMIELADKLGLSDLSKVLRNPHYFHHEILFNNDLAMTARANNSALGTENSKAEFTGIKSLDDLLNIVLNRSYMKKYKGSELDMNSNYLAVTADIRGQQLQDLAILKALNEIKDNYDISDKLREALNKNKANSSVESYSQEDFVKKLEEQMARENELRKSKGLKSESEENAGDGSGRAVDILNPKANNTQSVKTAEPVDYVKRLEDSLKNGDTVMGRLDRQLKLKRPVEIGKNNGLIDITDDGNIQIPDGYVAFDPDAHGLFGYDGRRSRIQVALSQGLEAAMTRTGLGEFTIEQIAEAMGHEEAKLWVIPKEVADTLKAFGAAKQPASFKKFLRKITKGWKIWQLFSPLQTVKYNIRNVTGDLDAVIAGNPQSLKYVGQATGELINSMFRGKAAEGELEQYLIRGGDLGSETAQYFTTGFTQAFFDFAKDPNFKVVTKELNGVKSFADFKRLSKRAFKALNKYSIGGIMKLSSFRENILRYANYLSYLEQMQRNENHMPDNWGASLREEIEAIPNIRDRAYKLSNELLGDYGSISELGMRLRDVAVPFYSWLEVNAKRYYRLLKNGIWDGNNKLDFSKGLLKGLAVQSPMIAYNTAKTLLWINALSIAIKAFNEAVNAGSGGADDDLPPEVKDRPHLTFGYTSDGRVSYFDRVGALLDIYDWVGQDSKGMIPFYRDIRDIINGNLSLTDFVKQTSSAAFNKAFNSLTPLLKMPVEIATGRTFYPDATHPRIIRDMTSYIAQSFGLSREVNALLDEPGRDYATWENWGSFKDLFRYTSDPKESAYFYILDKVRYFQEHTLGKTFDGGAITRRGQALRKFKTAVRYKDRANQRRYLRQYYNLGGTRKTLKQSIKSMGPLTGLSKDEKRQFMRSLTPEDRKYLRRAWSYFYDLAASTGVKVKYEYY